MHKKEGRLYSIISNLDGRKILRILDNSRQTPEQFARAIGANLEEIPSWLSGNASIPPKYTDQIALVYGTTILEDSFFREPVPV